MKLGFDQNFPLPFLQKKTTTYMRWVIHFCEIHFSVFFFFTCLNNAELENKPFMGWIILLDYLHDITYSVIHS